MEHEGYDNMPNRLKEVLMKKAEKLQYEIQSLLKNRPVFVRFEEHSEGSREKEKEETLRLRKEIRAELAAHGVPEPSMILSASHTRSVKLTDSVHKMAVLVVGSNFPLGVDLEKEDREVSEKVA